MKALKEGMGSLRKGAAARRWPYRLRLAIAACAACLATGCGVVHAAKDGRPNVAKSSTAPHAKTISFDLAAEPLINPDPDGQPLSVVIRFYQLSDAKTFAELTYLQLQQDDEKLLKDDLLATKDIVLRPGSSTSMTEPMNDATRVVGVIAFFREPSQDKAWKLAIPDDRFKDGDPVRIEADGNELRLIEASPPVKQ